MIEEGLFERFPCDAVFGLHNWPSAPAGTFIWRDGPMMAATVTLGFHRVSMVNYVHRSQQCLTRVWGFGGS